MRGRTSSKKLIRSSLGVIYIPNQCIYYFSIPYGDGKQRASHRCFDGGKIKLKNKQIDKIKKN